MRWSKRERRRFVDLNLEVEHVKAHHTTKDMQQQMSFVRKFITEGNEKADELAQKGAIQQHNEDNTNTTKSSISSTDTGPLHSKWHEACTVSPGLYDTNMFGQRGMDQSTGTLTHRQVRVVRTQREPTERVIIVIFIEREKKREEKENEGRERRKKERERGEERESEAPLRVYVQKRFRVYRQL